MFLYNLAFDYEQDNKMAFKFENETIRQASVWKTKAAKKVVISKITSQWSVCRNYQFVWSFGADAGTKRHAIPSSLTVWRGVLALHFSLIDAFYQLQLYFMLVVNYLLSVETRK